MQIRLQSPIRGECFEKTLELGNIPHATKQPIMAVCLLRRGLNDPFSTTLGWVAVKELNFKLQYWVYIVINRFAQ